MAVDLNEHGGGILLQVGDASTGDATRGLGGRRSAAHVHGNMVLLGQLLLGRGLVERWGVEFGQSILRDEDELLGCRVGGQGVLVLRVLALPELSCFFDGLVQGLDAGRESLNLVHCCRNSFLDLVDRDLETVVRALKSLQAVLGLVQLLHTVCLLGVVIGLLLTKESDHFVNHLEDLVKVARAATQGDEHSAETRVGVLLALQHRQRLVAHRLVRHLRLKQSGAWQCLLEQVKGIVIVENLDGLSQGKQLVSSGLGPLLPLLGLGVTVAVQSLQELLVLRHSSGRVVQVLLQVDNVNTNLAHSLCLGLDGFAVGSNFLLLGSHERIEIRDRLLLGRFRFL
mmetsp:Transcript_81290/g.169894  ORF Transcript_81290/g.169894 Transcript_81290/m.169894 type:complete len:341 (+) Transcript_81290:615-1637(+)